MGDSSGFVCPQNFDAVDDFYCCSAGKEYQFRCDYYEYYGYGYLRYTIDDYYTTTSINIAGILFIIIRLHTTIIDIGYTILYDYYTRMDISGILFYTTSTVIDI